VWKLLRQELVKVKAKCVCSQSVEDEHDKQKINDTMYKTSQKVRRLLSDVLLVPRGSSDKTRRMKRFWHGDFVNGDIPKTGDK